MPILRPSLCDRRLTRLMISWNVGTLNLPLNSVGRPPRVWRAPSFLISARVKSCAQKPLVGTPSSVRVVSREANSGCTFTSPTSVESPVVAGSESPRIGSWRAISTWSFVITRSGSAVADHERLVLLERLVLAALLRVLVPLLRVRERSREGDERDG